MYNIFSSFSKPRPSSFLPSHGRTICKVLMYISRFRIFLNFHHQGGVKSTVSKVFEDFNLKISEDYEQNRFFLILAVLDPYCPCH